MQIELNDDQVALLIDLLHRTVGDIHYYSEESGDQLVEHGYGSTVLLQTEYRMNEIFKTIQEQSGYNWEFNGETQRMEPRYKPNLSEIPAGGI